jgi:hypothetical protein
LEPLLIQQINTMKIGNKNKQLYHKEKNNCQSNPKSFKI